MHNKKSENDLVYQAVAGCISNIVGAPNFIEAMTIVVGEEAARHIKNANLSFACSMATRFAKEGFGDLEEIMMDFKLPSEVIARHTGDKDPAMMEAASKLAEIALGRKRNEPKK